MKFCSNHTGIKDNIKISKKVRVKKFLFKKWKQRYSAKIILNRTEIKIIKTRLTKKKKKNSFHAEIVIVVHLHVTRPREKRKRSFVKPPIRQKTPTTREIGFNYIKHAKPPVYDQNIS